MSRALKRVAPSRLDKGQEAFPLFYGSEEVPASDTPATKIAAAAKSSPSIFHDEEGRFVPRCACGAYGTFGVGQRTSLFKAHPTPWTYGEDGVIRDAQGGVVMYDLSSDDNDTCDGLYEMLVLVMNSYCPMLGALQDVQKFCQEEDSAVD